MPLPLPPVEQVRPGLWVVPVPIPDNPLRYVLVYVFEAEDGLYLVDAGWNTDDAFAALRDGIATVGGSLTDVRGVLVTHIHPDHYGLAGRVRDASGAWVALHPADAALVQARYVEPTGLLDRIATLLRAFGAPAEELGQLQFASMPVHNLVQPGEPDVLVEDGDRPKVPGWDITAIWTPGHSPGHLCFYVERHKLMLSGDHVLPRITPNIGYHTQSGPDPLSDFLASLEKLAPYDVDTVLPAHEHRFVGLQDRLLALREHHEKRFAEILTTIDGGARTGYEIAQELTWSRSWDRIEGFMRRAAVMETVAHLYALKTRGLLEATGDDPMLWRRAGR